MQAKPPIPEEERPAAKKSPKKPRFIQKRSVENVEVSSASKPLPSQLYTANPQAASEFYLDVTNSENGETKSI